MEQDEYHQKWVKKLNDVSPSFCVAKWKQVTLHLQIGHKHSCHHPPTHKIDKDAIAKVPSKLHNTEQSLKARRLMKEGHRPKECNFCWKAEDTGSLSDRVYKSAARWANNQLDEIVSNSFDYEVMPAYVEVSFNSTCNMKCIYCSPHISSKWMEEVKQHGGFHLKHGNFYESFNNMEDMKHMDKVPIKNSEDNPYIEAFWKWWPELYKNLKVFAITGGEPLLSKDTFKVLDYIIEKPSNPNLQLAVNSNLCVPEKNYREFLNKAKTIRDNKLVDVFTIHTSCEAKGKRAEYIRTGLDYNQHMDRYNEILKMCANFDDYKGMPKKTSLINHMCTFNNLSVTTFKDFVKDVVDARKSLTYDSDIMEKAEVAINHPGYKSSPYLSTVTPHTFLGTRISSLDIPFLRSPRWLSVEILTDNFNDYFEECYQYMVDEPYVTDIERIKFLRCWNVFKNNILGKEGIHNNRKFFVDYVNEIDRRRDCNFLETFPEYNEFYEYCKSC